MRYFSRFCISLFALFSLASLTTEAAHAATCVPSSFIASDCEDLGLTGSPSLVTIQSGVTVSGTGGPPPAIGNGAVYITNDTFNNLTNNGTITGDGGDYGVNVYSNSTPGALGASIGALTNTGTIQDIDGT